MIITPGIDYDFVIVQTRYKGKTYKLTLGKKLQYFEKIGYKPHSKGQWDFHLDTHRFKVVYAGRRYGKTMEGSKDIEPIFHLPGAKIWIVAPEYDLGEKEFRYMNNDLVKKLNVPLQSYYYNLKGGNMYMKSINDSELIVKSASNRKGLIGEGLHAVLMAEPANMEKVVWEEDVRPTLTDFGGIAIFPGTPKGFNYVYKLWKKGKEGKDANWMGFGPYPTSDNPHINRQDIEDAKDDLSEAAFAEQYLGIPQYFTGRIYKSFEIKKHVIPTAPIPHEWIKYRGIDPGNRGMFFCVWIAIDFEGNHIIYDEYKSKETTTDLHIACIKEISKNERYEVTGVDPSGTQVIEDLNAAGIMCIPASRANTKEWKYSRVIMVDRLINRNKLFVQEHNTDTITAFISHRWAERKVEGANRQAYNDEHSHPMDAVEYAEWMNPQIPTAPAKKKTIQELKDEERQAVWDRLSKEAFGRKEYADEHLGDF